MNKSLQTVVVAGVIGSLVLDLDKPAFDVSHAHTHEREPGPQRTVSFQVTAVSSGKEMLGTGPLVINRPYKAPL